VIRETVDDRRLAGAAGALGAGRQDADAGFLDDVEHGAFRRDGEGEPAAHELDLERLGAHRLLEWAGGEPSHFSLKNTGASSRIHRYTGNGSVWKAALNGSYSIAWDELLLTMTSRRSTPMLQQRAPCRSPQRAARFPQGSVPRRAELGAAAEAP
jgi:hypothetical protein